MPLDPDFLAESLYDADAIFLDEITEIDRDNGRVTASLTPHADLPLTASQRVVPGLHPRHVSGGLMVHLTGVLGLAHAYYCLDLRTSDGWVGFGARIHDARYPAIAVMDVPMILTAEATQVRAGARRVVARYRFTFEQKGQHVYRSEQSAMWIRPDQTAA